jgi:small multidrug resistance pump
LHRHGEFIGAVGPRSARSGLSSTKKKVESQLFLSLCCTEIFGFHKTVFVEHFQAESFILTWRLLMQNWLYLFVAIISETVATSSLKASEGFTRFFPSTLVVIGYGAAFYFLSLTLRVIPVGIAYAIWSGLGVILIALAGWLLFDQKLDTPAIIGMGLIVSGVIVMNVFSSTSAH